MIVIVVGMHRSGTSTVAGLLHDNGVVMGEEEVFLPRPGPENPRGFFENYRFRRTNDRIAERCGYAIDSWRPEIPPCRPGGLARLRMKRLLREYQRRYPLWGFKDPRTCLTLDGWLRALEGIPGAPAARIVFAVRDPEAVARSMVTRNGVEHAAALRLWRVYNERVLATLDAWKPPTHTVRYEDLCARPGEVTAALCRFAGASDGADISARLVDPALNRSVRAPDAGVTRVGLGQEILETEARILCRVRESRRERGPGPAPEVAR
jgi:hypothetical protein